MRAANPLVVADTWHFLKLVVLPYAQGDFSVGDLFIKRSAMDHSQPFRKLVLLASYEWFDLDFKFEAAVGILGAFAGLLVLWLMARSVRGARPARAAECLAFTALAAGYLSLSATSVFSWPLATMSFTNHVFIFMFAWAAWRGLVAPDRSSLVAVVIAGLALCLMADDTGLLTTIALALATLLHGWRIGNLRAAIQVVLACVVAYLLYALVFKLVSSTPDTGAAALPISSRLAALADQWRDAPEWVMVPLAGSVAHRRELGSWFGADFPAIGTLAALMMLAQLGFWWSALYGKRNVASFTATAIMLLFYALLAGILVARVSQYGSDYLWQPRYSIVYRWNLVALALMLVGQLAGVAGSPAPDARRRLPVWTGVASLLAAALVLVQIPLSVVAWERLPYIERYHQKQAVQIRQVAQAPTVPPGRCMSGVIVCRFPPETRVELLGFLQREQLNVFSQEFRNRHGMSAEPDRR